ncbi:MAG: hypothetical protein ACW99U_11230 [Candidatus Thorarchaeota archaeon]
MSFIEPMPNPKYPRNPARILTTAFKMDMGITLALARDRATGKSRPLYFGLGKRIKGMARIWNEAKKEYQLAVEDRSPDATVLLKVEHVIQRSFTRILLKTSVRYGNTETRRVKREEGNKGYLNILWDYSGSRIRDVAKARYFFPSPVPVERSDGSFILGYHGSSKTPFYPIRHNHLPELDFADMIRNPLMELVRQCMKYGVPIKDAKTYIDALLFRLLPFMDYVYTERRSGRSNYVRDGLRELRIIVEQIRRGHGTRNGQRQSITYEVWESVMSEDSLEEGLTAIDVVGIEAETSDEVTEELEDESDDVSQTHFLKEAVASAKKEGVIFDSTYLETVEGLLGSDTLTAEDSEELLRQAKEQSRRIGVRLHRFVAENFQSPFSLSGVIFHGKEMAYDDSGLILLSEVSVDDGRGRVDLVLAKAKELTRVDGAPSLVVCEPFMIVDLKTKSAFDFDIYGIESRTSDEDNVVSEFVLDRRRLTDDEWENALTNTPDDYERKQLEAYEKSILNDYKNVMRKDVDAQSELPKAVLVVDSYQDWKSIREAILPLVLRAYNGCVDGAISEGDILFPTEKDRRQRIAMRMLSVARPTTSTVKLNPPQPLEPFSERAVDEKEFILYLTVPGRGSPAQSAAVIAERWHGLEYTYDLARRQHRDVYWLDLVGEYKDPILRKKQFRLRFQPDPIKRFFKRRVQVEDLSSQLETCIYKGKRISSLRERIHEVLRDGRDPIIVVSGWETLRRSTPDSHHKYLDEIAATIIQALPIRSTALWFARPVPLPQNSTVYSTRCVAPFYRGTLWQNFVDTMVWNVAMSPDRSRARAPTNDHERWVFIEQKEQPLERIMIEVAPLRGWGEDFRSGGRKGKVVFHKGTSSSLHSSQILDKKLQHAMELIPHLVNPSEFSKGPVSNRSLGIEHVTSGYDTPSDPSPMLTFKPTQIHTQKDTNGRVKVLLPMTSIKRRREYRRMLLDVDPSKRSSRPPSEHYLSVSEVDHYKISSIEIRHLRDTIKFLRHDDEMNLKEILDMLSETLDGTSEGIYSEDSTTLINRLRLVRQILETSTLSKEAWERLLPFRSTVPRSLTLAQQEHIAGIQKKHPDILVVTGNHLFLLALAALGSFIDKTFTGSLDALWDYVQPWHLMGLGLKPVYPRSHKTGRSVLDRHRLMERLQQRIIEHNKAIGLQTSLTNVRFGQLVVSPPSEAADSAYLWLLFQRAPGIYDMNAALLSLSGIDLSLSILKTLHEMVSERTYWSESDLSRLGRFAKLKGNEVRYPVMIAEQQGLQVLFAEDKEEHRWVPVGQIRYTTRRFEDVTLVRTMTLSANPHLQPVDIDDVRTSIHQIKDLTDLALLTLNRELVGHTSVACEVSLDEDEEMYRVTFTEQGSDEEMGELLINRTADLLEILRRADVECEPVIVNGQRLIWNRFRDISYDGDVELVRPWVIRSRPFAGLALKLPPSAGALLKARKEFDMTLELYHDPWTCPIRHISMEAIQEVHKMSKTFGHSYRFRYEGQWGEPEQVSNEPGVHHGSCWRIHADTPHTLTPELRELMEVRLTDVQVRSLLSSQELVYWSQKRQEWMTHTFKVLVQKKSIGEIRESWHLRMMLEELTGRRYEPELTGAYLENPDRWNPSIIIKPECVEIGLREKDTDIIKEHILPEENVALRHMFNVEELLEQEMGSFLKKLGISADRRLTAAIREEIADAMEISGVSEDRKSVVFEEVEIGLDSVGGNIIYVVLTIGYDTHRVPVTGHLHDIRRLGRVAKDEFIGHVMTILDEFDLSDEDKERALEGCLRVMRKEKLMKR